MAAAARWHQLYAILSNTGTKKLAIANVSMTKKLVIRMSNGTIIYVDAYQAKNV